jgi:hypothetical protein
MYRCSQCAMAMHTVLGGSVEMDGYSCVCVYTHTHSCGYRVPGYSCAIARPPGVSGGQLYRNKLFQADIDLTCVLFGVYLLVSTAAYMYPRYSTVL